MMNDQLLNMKQELIQTPPSLLTQMIVRFEIIAKKGYANLTYPFTQHSHVK